LSAARPPRKHRRALIASVGAAVLAAGVIAWTFGPGGPVLVSHFADGRSIWRLGKLHLEGVSGAGLGDLRAARATLSDEDGVWAEATDLALGWDPLALATGVATIRTASAVNIHILRQPKLTAPKPPGGTIDVDLTGLAVTRLDIDKAVLGEKAAFRLDGGLAARNKRIARATLNAVRLDAPGDALHLDLERTETIRLNATIDGPAAGFFSTALKTDEAVTLAATANGTEDAGDGALDAHVGKATLATGAFGWSPTAWRGGGDIALTAAPALASIAEALGESVHVEGEGARDATRKFSAKLAARHLAVAARGRLGDDWRPTGATAIVAHADRLQEFVPGVGAGGARFDGALTTTDAITTVEGRLDGVGVESGILRTSFSGLARVRVTNALADIEAEVAISEASGAPSLTRLLRGGKLSMAGRLDRIAQRFIVRSAHLVNATADVTGDGALGSGAPGLTGRWRVTQLNAVDPAIDGRANGAWRFGGGFDEQPFLLTAEGAASRFTTTLQPLDQMLGPTPRIDALFAIRHGDIAVRRFIVTAPKLRLGATGAINNGVAALTFEASARGPVRVGAAQFDGVADASGAVRGRLDNPAVTAEARMSRLDVAGLAVDQPVVTLTFAPTRAGREGRIDVVGAVSGERATAEAKFHTDTNGLRLSDLAVNAAGFTARGEAAFTRAGPSLAVTYAGQIDKLAPPLTGRIAGTATLRPAVYGEAVLEADAHLKQGRIGALAFSQLDAAIAGPLDALVMRASVRGAASGEAVTFDATGHIRRAGAGAHITLEGQGSVAATNIATNGPVDIRLAGNAVSGHGAFALGDGAGTFDLSDARERLSFSAKLDNAPIAPIFALFGERAAGRASGTLTASGNGSLDGEIDMAVTDALFARRARDPLTMKLTGGIGNGVLTVHADATSRNGLDAALDARAPVNARARPLRIALAGEGRATWRAKGPADALWGLVGSLDQAVTGNVDGEGALQFAVGRLSGEGGLTLTQGSFSDKQTGVELRDIEARVHFDNDAARLEKFSARDVRGGALTGTGEARGLKDGHVELIAHDIQLLGRPDARAIGSGPLSLKWTENGATLSGDLQLSQATLAPPRPGETIPVLAVIEINRPDTLLIDTEKPSALPNVTLDVRVRAPGRVSLRGRGLDSEWALDMRVAGAADAPKVYGEARLVRGRFTLAGRPFEAERGLIRFNGAPEEALIDLVAEMSSTDLTVRLALSGAVSDPDIQLSSTPSLPEDEILPQALFGRAAEDLSALEAAQLAASLAELAGQSSLNLAGAARDLVGLDRFDVRESGDGLRVAGGKYLTRDVYLEVARTGIGETETQVEWRVRPQLYLISAFEPSGDRRLSVRWRREY